MDQPVLFQYEYINYAWGYRHHGFMISPDGTIHGFRQPTGWREFDSIGLISKSDLEYNLNQCDTVFGVVDKDLLTRYFNQVDEIRTGSIKDLGMHMADAGTGVFSAWFWISSEQKFERVFLISNGDVNQVNDHSKTNGLVQWLKKTGQRTDRFYWFGDQ